MSSFRSLTSLALAAALAVPFVAADGQGFMDRLKKKAEETAKRKVEERVDQRTGEAADRTLDRTEGALKCVFTDRTCIERAKKDGREVELVDESGAAVDENGARVGVPGAGANAGWDFVPGDRVIFETDFSSDRVGDFPRRFAFRSGNIEVVEWSGARYLSTHTFGSSFSIPLPEELPAQFTLEFDYSASGGNGMEIHFVDPAQVTGKTFVDVGVWSGGLRRGGIDAIGKPSGDEFRYRDAVFRVRVMADDAHVKVYMGDTRVANVPNADLGRSKAIHFVVPGREDRAAMIGAIRIAAGGRDLYDALAADGRVTAEGILFDTGSDGIRPESAPVLARIAGMLTSHPELALTIEGHTDNVGAAAANQRLSEQRAAAVKAYLVERHGIDAARLTSAGLGASRPAASNDTPDGRQKNRRVELVRN